MNHETYLSNRFGLENSHRLDVVRPLGGWETFLRVLRDLTPERIIDIVKASGLRGRGGAGFPTGVKWTFMPGAEDTRPRYLAVNADESEPGTCKDRVLMLRDPHLLLEGIAISSFALRANTAYVYVRYEYREPFAVLQEAIREANAAGLLGKDIQGTGYDLDIHLHPGAGAYICGEETALMESLEGKRGHPRPKPPFPAGFGLWGMPTTVNNVETLANVPAILEKGAEWYRTMGTETGPGNILCGVSGHVERPGVYEIPLGTPVRRVIDEFAGGVWKGRKLKGFYAGGSSVGILPADKADVPLDYDELRKAGSMLGTAGLIVLDEEASVIHQTRVLARFYDHETCGQCSQCRCGCEWLHQILRRIDDGHGHVQDVPVMRDLLANMSGGKTICAFADGAAQPMRTAIQNFPSEFQAATSRDALPKEAAG